METDYLTLGLAKWSIIARVRALTLCTRPNFNSGCQGPNKRVCRLLNPNGALAHSAAIAIVPAALEKFRLFFRWRRGSLSYPPRETIFLFLTLAANYYRCARRCSSGIIASAVQCVNFTAAGTNNYFSANLPLFLPSSFLMDRTEHTKRGRERLSSAI